MERWKTWVQCCSERCWRCVKSKKTSWAAILWVFLMIIENVFENKIPNFLLPAQFPVLVEELTVRVHVNLNVNLSLSFHQIQLLNWCQLSLNFVPEREWITLGSVCSRMGFPCSWIQSISRYILKFTRRGKCSPLSMYYLEV